MNFQLSDRAKELIPKARIVSTAGLREAIMTPIKAADDEGRYLTDEELGQLEGAQATPDLVQSARFLRDNAKEIVTDARQSVLAAYPGITEPGGDLYPAMRAEACWRDFWHFLRCISYGIASSNSAFTSDEGLGYMNELYGELKVPLPAMVTGLESLKRESLKRLPQQTNLATYFDHLIGKMRSFS